MRVQVLDVPFAAVVSDIDLREVHAEAFAELHAAWLEHPLLIFPAQHLDRAEQDTFARRFGDLEFEAVAMSNIRPDGTVESDPDDDLVKSLRGNEGWHHDSTFMPVQSKGAVLSAEIVPTEGGETGWADMRAAYESLDDETRELVADKVASHSMTYSQRRAGYLPKKVVQDDGIQLYGYPDGEVPVRPLVKVHPETGRPNLIVGRHAHDVAGMSPEESERLLDRLNEAATAPDNVHFHHWTAGDVVLWDNRRLVHRVTPYDMTQPRQLWHTRIAGDPASEAALNRAAGAHATSSSQH